MDAKKLNNNKQNVEYVEYIENKLSTKQSKYIFKALLKAYNLLYNSSNILFLSATNIPELYGYSLAWIHHKGRNKHHFEYWNDYNPNTKRIEPVRMPVNCVKEMF